MHCAGDPSLGGQDYPRVSLQAAYIAHIIHQNIPSVSQNAIGKLFGIKSISTYLGKLDTKESIKKPLEDIFIERELKLVF
ncbi:MAG: hypothetical protein IIU09_02480 [Bacteroidales bacterium]|nr:hypothetical protein [Bacteroidales bacterium]